MTEDTKSNDDVIRKCRECAVFDRRAGRRGLCDKHREECRRQILMRLGDSLEDVATALRRMATGSDLDAVREPTASAYRFMRSTIDDLDVLREALRL